MINPLAKPKNAAEVLLGQEDVDAQAKRGYATARNPNTTVLGKPLNYDDIYDTSVSQVPDYIKKEGQRIAAVTTPSAGAVRATGLSPIDALRQASVEAGGLPATSAIAEQYTTRATNGINSIFGGATGINRPDLEQLLPSQLASYQTLARTTGSLPTAEAAAGYDNLLPSEKAKLTATIEAAKNQSPDLRGTGLSRTATAGALRLARAQGEQ